MSHWDVSTLSEDRLQELEGKELLPSRSFVQWRASGADREPRPRDGETVLFEGYVYAGLRLPENPFLREILQDAGLELINLNPNSVLMAAVFVHLCEAFVGVKPTINIFKHYYAVYWGKGTGPLGCVYFRLRNDMAAGYPLLPTKDSLFGWHRNWFYIQVSKDSALLYKRGQKPQRVKQKEALQPLSEEEEEVVLAIKCLTSMGLTGRTIITDWLTNRVSPLRHREKAFFEMEGPEDVSRDSSLSLDPEEIKSRVRYLLKSHNEDKEQPKNVLERAKREKIEFSLEAEPVISRKWTSLGGDDLPKRKRAKRVRKGLETPPSISSSADDRRPRMRSDRRAEPHPLTTSSSDEEGTALFTKYKKIVAPSPLEVLASAIVKNTSGSEYVSLDEQPASLVRAAADFIKGKTQDAAPVSANVVMGDEQTTDDNGCSSQQIPVTHTTNVIIGVEHTSDAPERIERTTALPADKTTAVDTDLSAGPRAMVVSSTSTTSDPSSATGADPSGMTVSEQSRFEKELMDIGMKSINEMVRFTVSFISRSAKASIHKDELIKQKDQMIKQLTNELKKEKRFNEQLSEEVAKITAEKTGLRKEMLGELKKLEERINHSS